MMGLVGCRKVVTSYLIAQDLKCKMLQYDPARRITADEALKHPFFYDGAGGMP
jgi:serine/threonine protein kinase